MELELNNIKWIKYHNVLMPDEPCDKNIYLSKKGARLLFKKTGAYFIRYTSDFDCAKETEFWYIVKDKRSSMEELSAKTKKAIRKGFINCIVKKVNAEFIACNGYEVYRKAFTRYKTDSSPVSEAEFYSNMMIAKNDDNYEFFGVFEKLTEQLIAYCKNKIQDNLCNYIEMKYNPEFSRLFPSYALFCEMNNYYLNERMYRLIVTGSRNINHKTNIEEFLINKFKFRKAYCRLNIYYSVKVALVVKLIYPFRKVISRMENKTINKLKVLIMHEEIRRSYNNK